MGVKLIDSPVHALCGHSIFRIKKLNQIAAPLFGLIHCRIRPLEDVFQAAVMLTKQCRADARRALMRDYGFRFSFLLNLEHDRLSQRGADLLGNDVGLCDGF